MNILLLAATSSYKIDPNWYNDTGATNHITSDLDRLTVRERYNGGEQVQVDNGAGLRNLLLVILQLILLLVLLHCVLFCMCLKFSNIFFPFINFPVIMTYSLNTILRIFLLRINGRGKVF